MLTEYSAGKTTFPSTTTINFAGFILAFGSSASLKPKIMSPAAFTTALVICGLVLSGTDV